MTSCLNTIAWICLIGGILIGALSDKNGDNAGFIGSLVLAAFAAFFIIGLFLIPIARNDEIHDKAKMCVVEAFGNRQKITMGEPICIASTRYGCLTWESKFTVGKETKGTVTFNLETCGKIR